MAQHTQGPWRVDPRMPNAVFASDETRSKVAATKEGHAFPVRSDEEAAANARLIAAAPDLLAVLDECRSFLTDLTNPDTKASGPAIIASFTNAVALGVKVDAALARCSSQVEQP